MMKSFAPLKIRLTLEVGYVMDYRIVEKASFTVMGAARKFKYDGAMTEIPKLWQELHQPGKKRVVCGMYGISIDESMGSDEFEYLVADNYNPALEIPEGFVTRVIPAHTWAVFACRGEMPHSLQDINKKIFSEWLPNSRDYEIAAGCNIEMYSNPAKYPGGIQDKKYYSEIWIPVKKK